MNLYRPSITRPLFADFSIARIKREPHEAPGWINAYSFCVQNLAYGTAGPRWTCSLNEPAIAEKPLPG